MELGELREWIFQTDDTVRSEFWTEHSLKISLRLSLAYLLFAIGALIAFALSGSMELKQLGKEAKVFAVLAGVFVSAAPPAWFWFEARAYDDWLNKKHPGNSTLQAPYRETYRIHSEHARAFWAGILAAYAAALMAW